MTRFAMPFVDRRDYSLDVWALLKFNVKFFMKLLIIILPYLSVYPLCVHGPTKKV